MICRYCKIEPDIHVLLPWHADSLDLSAFACEDCAHKLGIVCPLHNQVHQGFEGYGHACLRCIEDQTNEYWDQDRNPLLFLAVFAPQEELIELVDWMEGSVAVTGDHGGKCVLRAVITAAHQYKTGVEEFLTQLYNQGSIRRLLHPSFEVPTSLPP